MQYTPKEIETNVNVSDVSSRKEFAVLLGGVVAIIVIAYLALGLAVDVIVPRLPAGVDHVLSGYFGRAFHDLAPTAADAYLRDLLRKLVQASPLKGTEYVVHLIPSSEANALALPGGHIVVLSGLLEQLESENELAFILAHELGHFAHRDHLRGLGRGLVIATLSTLILGGDSDVTNFLVSSVLNVMQMRFSQAQETQADLFGVEVLASAYGHIGGATDFFTKLAQAEARGRLTYFFATHPYPADRVAQLLAHVQAKNYPTGAETPLPEDVMKLNQTIADADKRSLKEIFGL